MAACSFLLSVGSVDELNGVRAEVRARARGGRGGNAVPDDLGEVAGDRSAASVGGDGLEMERGPRDDVVGRVRAGAGQGVVDGEEELRAEPRLERLLDRGVVPLGSRVGEV